MGVKGLWELVAPVGRRVSLDTVRNKTLAVDVSIWLTQFLYAMRDSEGELIRNAHLLGILRRCCKLIFYNVTPIFVFDGATPQLKRRTLNSRRNQRNKQKVKLRRLAEQIVLNELKLKKLKEKTQKEPKRTENQVDTGVNSRDLYNQYMDTVLKATLERNNAETEKNTEQLDSEALDDNLEQRDSITEEPEIEAHSNETEEDKDKEDNLTNVEVSNLSENTVSFEKEEYEVPNFCEMSSDSLALLPPEMFETVVSEIRSRERNLHREEFIKVENNPADFSQKQLEGFLRLSLTKREVMKARATAYSHLGHGRRRIASDPGKNYTLTKTVDSVPENGDALEPNDSYQFPTIFRVESSIDNNNNKVDEGLEWTRLVSNTERHLESLEKRESVMELGKGNEEFYEGNLEEEDEDIEWIACPPDANCNFVEQKVYSKAEVELDVMEQNVRDGTNLYRDNSSSAELGLHLDEDNTEDEIMTTDIQSAIYSSLANEQCSERKTETCADSYQNYSEDIPKVLIPDKDDNVTSLQVGKEDSEDMISSKVDEEKDSFSYFGDTQDTYFEESLDEEDRDREVSRDFILPDEKLENLFQEFEKERRELRQEFTHLKSGSDIITDEMCEEIRELLRMLGIPYIQAPMEAEAQCAYFSQVGLVEGVVTEDSDAFLFGAKTVFRNIFEDKKYVEQYEMEDIERYLGLNREKLILLSLLLGSDYTQGIHGVGVVNATEIMRAFPSFEELIEFAHWANQLSLKEERISLDSEDPNFVKNEFFLKHRKMKRNWVIHDSFPNKHVVDAYRYPMVDTSSIEFHCQRPNIAQLVEFCRAKFGWNSDKVKKLVIPVLKAYDARNQRQTCIEQYFHPMRFAKIKSKRLENAVRGITRAVDEEMFLSQTREEHVDDATCETLDAVSPRKRKKKQKKSTKERRKKSSSVESDP
ncbi:DNA repair protein UVH3 [Galdieria sulphuraria]|uniref:DNA excision repair protein ERCC-5 n=1 Tax=Galdieria sulphuraria TaxID=130081 RepID=M2XLM0_GALSU|nr:DNA excision repair protein ERCC-5 [Galdieria sulphuraria]EME31087.1 DNA excision repair protein ERCC-5 [Galdieria sulphuraria]GJD12444.1 DNA repair protein UVH3 [Galdieria sulphuraria]|eukprot:XP_005707607.1 DNA excision repair protein ERCC-5 [Galdieria sulphuraria]